MSYTITYCSCEMLSSLAEVCRTCNLRLRFQGLRSHSHNSGTPSTAVQRDKIRKIVIMIHANVTTSNIYKSPCLPFKDEAQTALFKDSVRTAQ
jgi:hypothetical protein